jgi:hypothetical protein
MRCVCVCIISVLCLLTSAVAWASTHASPKAWSRSKVARKVRKGVAHTNRPFHMEQPTETSFLLTTTMFGGWLGSLAHASVVAAMAGFAGGVHLWDRWRR